MNDTELTMGNIYFILNNFNYISTNSSSSEEHAAKPIAPASTIALAKPNLLNFFMSEILNKWLK